MNKLIVAICLFTLSIFTASSQNDNQFRQLKTEFATPNVYRTGSGAPGHAYYQQRADYDMKLILDDKNQRLEGAETITYFNNSPDVLTYLWVQLDQNIRAKDSDAKKIASFGIDRRLDFGKVLDMHNPFDGGYKIDHVKNSAGKALKHTIRGTMMRIDLPQSLAPKGSTKISIKWSYNINDRMVDGGRSGYEHFKEEDNYLYTIAQFFPRMAVYNDVEGWQNKAFIGQGEFALPFGNYKVSIEVPSDHVVAATGELQNASSVLTKKQIDRFKKAKTTYDQPMFIVTPEEAKENEQKKAPGTKTWTFKATNVRDFAFASSRKFMWDAMAVKLSQKTVLAMSFYPKEGNPLWEKYSTKVVAQTLKTYSKYTFDYPYPVAQSINAKNIGMEYPMICFNYGRPKEDGTYAERTKYGVIGVIIHEVGHNYFPMIVNSDERQWTWMDEGLNTYLQYLTEQEWERGFPSNRGPAYKAVRYMDVPKENQSPIMTNSEISKEFWNLNYGKPATALNILRETVLGRELFDFAFKEYANRWKFKHPTPEDFFRTMEDASGVDLDWFWRGWFYSTDHVDIKIDGVKWFKIDTQDPTIEKPLQKAQKEANLSFISDSRNEQSIPQTVTEKDTSTVDFYTEFDPFAIMYIDKIQHEKYVTDLTEEEKALLNKEDNYYELSFSNLGGICMPIILRFEFTDGTHEERRIPAEIWQVYNDQVKKVFFFAKEVKQIVLDPHLETADTDVANNYWPAMRQPSKFKLYKQNKSRNKGRNKMQIDRVSKELEKKSK